MAKKRKCIICGTKYEYCRNCSRYNPEETWRNLFCSENCMNIFNIVSKCNDTKELTVQEAYNELSKADLTKKSQFNECILTEIEKILSDGEPKTSIEKIDDSNGEKNKKTFIKKTSEKKKENIKEATKVVENNTTTEKIVND